MEMVTDKKKLDDLMNTLGDNRLQLHEPCMAGTRTTILQKIEDEIKNVDCPNCKRTSRVVLSEF